MSAERLSVITIAFPDPTIDGGTGEISQIDAAHGFNHNFGGGLIRTLSTNEAVPGADITGLLYVPLLTSEECRNASEAFVSPNATHRDNVPHNDYSLIAIAPWFSPECMLEYLANTIASPTNAFLTYIPDNSSGPPPQVNAREWGLGDGGAWKRDNNFPVYAIPGSNGFSIVDALADYSGKNVTEVPFGRDLVQKIPATDYVRLWVKIATDDNNKLPSLWVFLLITLGLLVLIIGSTSLTMHFLQRRRRNDLRRRVVAGEVDLEALGIKRLTVPQDVLDKMPLYAYRESAILAPPEPAHQIQQHHDPSDKDLELGKEALGTTMFATSDTSLPPHSPNTAYSQPTCAICLDDFTPNVTTVRELPCRHIFHPDCIDTFLLNNSSLCPMCKHSTLPAGFCPSLITNAMVRRERNIRRLRERRAAAAASSDMSQQDQQQQEPVQRGRWASVAHAARANMAPDTRTNRLYRDALADLMTGNVRNGSRRGGSSRGAGSVIGSATGANGVDVESARDLQPDIEMTHSPRTAAIPPSSSNASTDLYAPAPAHNSEYHNNINGNNNTIPPTSDPSHAAVAAAVCTTSSPAPGQSRAEWRRQRAMALLGRRGSVFTDADEEARRRPGWKRVVGKVWPW